MLHDAPDTCAAKMYYSKYQVLRICVVFPVVRVARTVHDSNQETRHYQIAVIILKLRVILLRHEAPRKKMCTVTTMRLRYA